MEISIATRVEREATVVRLTGDLDVITAPRVRERLSDLIRRGHYDLVVDLNEVSFLDSTGLAVLVNTLKRARAHDGSVRVVCTSEAIVQLLRITGLTRTFTIHQTNAQALASVEPKDTPPDLWEMPRRSVSPGPSRQTRAVGR